MSNGEATRADNGWNEYSKLVLAELKRLDKGVQENGKKIDALAKEVTKDLTQLKAKIGIYSAAAGLIFGGVVSAVVSIILA